QALDSRTGLARGREEVRREGALVFELAPEAVMGGHGREVAAVEEPGDTDQVVHAGALVLAEDVGDFVRAGNAEAGPEHRDDDARGVAAGAFELGEDGDRRPRPLQRT